MDIDILAKLIREIALEHDEVSLPEVGTFFAELAPAAFSDKGYSMTPPYRKLSFRQRVGTDTLLAEAYAKSAGISQEKATEDLAGFLSGLKEILAIKKIVIFPGLGKMRVTKENVIFFVPDADLDIYPDGYGLKTVSLRTHGGETTCCPAAAPSSPVEPSKHPVEPLPQPAAPAPPSTIQPQKEKKGQGPLKTIIFIAIMLLLLAGALAFLGRTAPELVDKLLYSPQDYKLLHG